MSAYWKKSFAARPHLLPAVLALTVGTAAAFGCLLNLPGLREFFSSAVPMKMNTAICFCLTGILLLTSYSPQKNLQILFRIARFALIAVSGLSLLEFILPEVLNIDQIFFTETMPAVGLLPPGRMSCASAFCFVVLGSYFFVSQSRSKAVVQAVYAFASIGLGCSILGVMAFLFNVTYARGSTFYIQMPINTAATMIPIFCSVLWVGLPAVQLNAQDKLQFLRQTGFILLVVVCGFALHSFSSALTRAREEHRGTERLVQMGRILNRMLDRETGSRGYLVTQQPLFLDPVKLAAEEIAAARHLIQDIDQDPVGRERLSLLDSQIAAVAQFESQSIELIKKHRQDLAIKLVSSGEGKRRMDAFRQTLSSIQSEEILRQKARVDLFEQTSRISILMIVTGGLIGLLLGVVAIFVLESDIQRRDALEKKLRMSEDEARASDRLKSSFLANMSHEIRTPLNGIIGMTDLLLETELDPEQNRFAAVIHEAGKNLLMIIQDILDFSKIEAGKLDFESIDFSILSVLENQTEIMSGRARDKNLSLISFCDPKIPSQVKGDPGRLAQVILNLVANAIKFTNSGRIIVRARHLELSNAKIQIRFEVEDTGMGMSEETMSKLFRPFEQADSSTARKFGGTGLGLSICKKLAQLMGGDIGVTSKLGEGSTFWFEACFEKATATSRKAYESPRSDISHLKALVIDDDPATLEIMSSYLGAWGMPCRLVLSGKEALAILKREEFQVIFVDKRMPDSDGFKVAAAIRSFLGIKTPRMILFTAYDRPRQRENALAEGFDDYLTKPLKQSDLYNAIARGLLTAEQSTKNEGAAPEETPVTQRTEKILIAEDNSANQILVSMQLQKLGFKAHLVSNGLEVIEAWKMGNFDLILMDCQMPEMDGFAATRRIRELEKGSNLHIPIIALTANAMSEDRAHCLEAGMDDYLPKPFKRDNLGRVIDRWLRSTVVADPAAENPIEIEVDSTIQSIVPSYLENKRKEVEIMKKLLESQNFGEIHRLGHSLKGSGGGYGFMKLTEIGGQLETAADVEDREKIDSLLTEMTHFLKRVKPKYIAS